MISTGIKGLDNVITGLKAGDNVVWQIDDIKDYIDLVKPLVSQALKENRRVIYIRFASHKEVLERSASIKRYELDAYAGFESFTTKINDIITQEGEGAYYVFDCLSELLRAWASDLMIGNFFMVTCPYLFELKTVTYFSILRNNHSFKSIALIRETTQLLIDVYRCEGSTYIHPLKVWNRYSPTMFLPHQKKGLTFIPVTDSADAVKILSYISEKGLEGARRNLDYWDRLFLEAEELVRSAAPKGMVNKTIKKLAGIMITNNRKILPLLAENLTLEELIDIKSRLIGTGFIGGKSAGMLLARKILSKRISDWQRLSEPHDSFFVGSDIFYTYLVQNHLWKLRMQQKTQEGYFTNAKILKERMLYGTLSEETKEQFQRIIEYFGSSPIIIRSSSLLEDSFGNAFAGKYESVFLANQGTPEQRFLQFADAVKKIYASTMSEDALAYRRKRHLDKLDEQMALLVQRVSGAPRGNYFFPDLAGVGVSHNIYVWNETMAPEAGMLRLVFGLGTRAVNRVEGDYPRMVALDEPMRRPYSENDDLREFSQHDVDLISTKENVFKYVHFEECAGELTEKVINLVATRDYEAEGMINEGTGSARERWLLTLDNVFKKTTLADSLRKILRVLESSYDYPVEIEFTVNFASEKRFRINLLQYRPMQTRGLGHKIDMPRVVKREDTLFGSTGYFLGGNIAQPIKRVIYIDPKGYVELTQTDKYEIARIVGELNRSITKPEILPTLLMGPGRWGTTTPSLGVPVKFAEINNITVLAEVAFPSGNLKPELSFGTHFFHDLVETNIFYLALFPDKKGIVFNRRWFGKSKNIFLSLTDKHKKYGHVVEVYDVEDRGLRIMSDIVSQKVICCSGRGG